jgi:hypothetical protein
VGKPKHRGVGVYCMSKLLTENSRRKSTAEVEKISSSSLVVKGNDLIISRYNLSLAEQRLILQVVSMIDKDDEDFKDYYVSISDYLDLVESNSNNYYQVKNLRKNCLKNLYIYLCKVETSWLVIGFQVLFIYPKRV